MDRRVVRRLSDELEEEYPLPYFFDIVNYNDISDEDFKDHIEFLNYLPRQMRFQGKYQGIHSMQGLGRNVLVLK